MIIEPLYIALASIVIVLLFGWVIFLQIKIGRLLGRKAGNLDESISLLRKDTDTLKKFAEKTDAHLSMVDQRLRKTISGNETVRFNPFKGNGSGSNQSFATAFVNAEGNGVVISSLYAREHVSVFSKPIKNLQSEYELTAEEKEALEKAKESIL